MGMRMRMNRTEQNRTEQNKTELLFLKNGSSQANIRTTFIDQKSPRHPCGCFGLMRVEGGGQSKKILKKRTHFFFFFQLCHRRPILGIGYLTRGLHDTRKWVFRDGADTQSMATL